MDRNHRLIIILLFLCLMYLIVASCKSSKSSCDAYGFYWNKKGVDSLLVVKDNSVFLPYIPVMDATAFHMDSPKPGTYTFYLKAGDSVIETKSVLLK